VKFQIEGKRTQTTVLTEYVSCEIQITKAEVQRVTDCPNAIDGDSTAWYDYVSEAIEMGADYKIVQLEKIKPDEIDSEGLPSFSIDNVEWL